MKQNTIRSFAARHLFAATTVLSAVYLPAALAQTIVNNIYSEKGLAGTMSQTQLDASTYTSQARFGWNNRRIVIDETLKLDDKGRVLGFEVQGQSAFGADISESYVWENGHAKWRNNDEQSSANTTQPIFYVPKNSTLAIDNALIRYLIKNDLDQIEVLPHGKITFTKLDTVKLGDEQVYLYAKSGLTMTPDFAWYDEEGNYFAQSWGGMYVIRDGFSTEQFDQLKARQLKAEQIYLETLAKQLTEYHSALLLDQVNVFDVEKGTTRTGQQVLIEQGKIVQVAPKIKLSKKVATVNGQGKTLIPGLWDMHGHLSKDTGILNIATGVTSVRDMGNEHQNLMEIQSLFDTGKVLGTRVYRAGFMDKYSENSAGLSVKTLEEALEMVDFFADNGYVQIKLYSSIDPKWVEPIAQRAHSRGLRLSGHIPAFMTAEQAVHAGYNEIQHINMLFLNFLAGEKVDTRTKQRFSLIGEKAAEMPMTGEEMDTFIKLLADKNVVIDPTVSTFRSLLMSKNKQIDQEFAEIASHLPPNFVRNLKGAQMQVEEAHQSAYQNSGDAMLKMVKILYDAGVPMVAGTDSVPGFTLLRELELYTMAGIPATEVLKMATIDSARLMGVAHQTGSISEGKVADLLLVDGDPSQDIKALRKLSLVIKGTQVFKPEAIFEQIGIAPFTKASRIVL
ncbi:amidohydrolase family protein [Pseudoalteromonas sp. XMcav2-N-2]|uniref:amidohydrolase family protein n=1 Tax=unclassified Pseudoalteromonas TaxID=194690 RepID=UPI002096BFC7|nr:amidohydrolase family protein [Pseudoalteromonas sp. XMcav2-N]